MKFILFILVLSATLAITACVGGNGPPGIVGPDVPGNDARMMCQLDTFWDNPAEVKTIRLKELVPGDWEMTIECDGKELVSYPIRINTHTNN